MVTQGTLERLEPSGQAGKGFPGVLHQHELLDPGGGIDQDEALKNHLQILIGTL